MTARTLDELPSAEKEVVIHLHQKFRKIAEGIGELGLDVAVAMRMSGYEMSDFEARIEKLEEQLESIMNQKQGGS